ncbi:hypothetical protein MTO96_003522 [Rhipicephalus appendiculatus]
MSLGGALECCAVTVRLNGVDTTVASVYVRPGQRWNATELLHLTSRLGSDFLLCGDMNAHHTMWGSRTCSSRGSELVDVIHQLGLQVLNTGSFTFVRRTGRPSCSAIDISLASEGARYDWATQPDSWGSDHLPIIITPVGGKIRRTRQCTTIDWRAFRQRLREAPVDQDFLGLVAAAAQAATIQCRVPGNHPVPDLRHLNLRAARRKAERRYLKAQSSEHRTLFNRVDAVCRRHANRRRRQSWQGICHSLSWARGGSRAWRLLRSLVIGPMARQPVLSVAIRLGISEQELAERLADRFTARWFCQSLLFLDEKLACGGMEAGAAEMTRPSACEALGLLWSLLMQAAGSLFGTPWCTPCDHRVCPLRAEPQRK